MAVALARDHHGPLERQFAIFKARETAGVEEQHDALDTQFEELDQALHRHRGRADPTESADPLTQLVGWLVCFNPRPIRKPGEPQIDYLDIL